jgi:putative pyruvate formate lyase activating enzyme
MKKTIPLLKTKSKTVSFQSDIVIDEDGEIFISFFGADLLHLIDETRIESTLPREWTLPSLSPSELDVDLESIKQEYSNCMMCPKQCGFDRVKSSHPNCGDWQLRVSNFGISFGDEKDISRGGGSGVLFLSGCPLTCPSCINGEKVRSDNTATTIQDFLLMVETLYQKGANNIQILSPSVHLPQLRLILKLLKKYSFPLPIIFKSSGYESSQELGKFKGLVDVYIPDYKFSTSCYWKKQSGADDYHEVFQKCLDEMYNQVGAVVRDGQELIQRGVIIRHVKNPYLEENERQVIDSFLADQSKDILISIQDNFVVLD